MKKDELRCTMEELSIKLCLTPTEASVYSGLGINTIEIMLRDDTCPFLIRTSSSTRGRRLVKREQFEEFIRQTTVVDL